MIRAITAAVLVVLAPGLARATATCSLSSPATQGNSTSGPCSVEELLACVIVEDGSANTPDTFWSTVLFASNGLDGRCTALNAGGPTLAAGMTAKAVAVDYCARSSNTQANANYFAFANFSAAASSAPFSDFFACGTQTYAEKKRMLAIILATLAQETTGVKSVPGVTTDYTQDGLFQRFEEGALGSADTTDSQKKLTANLDYETLYYVQLRDQNAVYVATDAACTFPNPACNTHSTAIWTNYAAGAGNQMQPGVTAKDPELFFWQPSASPPVGFSMTGMWLTWPQPAYCVGAGPIQLTGQALGEFYSFYQQNLATGAPVTKGNFSAFTKTYAQDGILGFKGGLWYLRNRVRDSKSRPAYASMSDATKPICNSIAAITQVVNGGCNNFTGRNAYYEYFKAKLQVGAEPASVVDASGNTLSPTTCALPYPLIDYCGLK